MRVRWFGQSAFHLAAAGVEIFVDPFANDVEQVAAAKGLRFTYPPIEGVGADVLLISHEHFDHNGASALGMDATVRSTAGKFETASGEVVAIAGEHDDVAGTARGPVSLFCFTVGGVRVCHLSDLGQRDLRDEQLAAIDDVDLLFVPVGGGPTTDGPTAAAITKRLAPTWVVPMHYRTDALDFLGPLDPFVDTFPAESVVRLDSAEFDTDELRRDATPIAVVPVPPAPTS